LIDIGEPQSSAVSESDHTDSSRGTELRAAVTNRAHTGPDYANNDIQTTITDDEVLGKGEPVKSGDRIATWYSLKLMDGTICINATASNGPPVRLFTRLKILINCLARWSLWSGKAL